MSTIWIEPPAPISSSTTLYEKVLFGVALYGGFNGGIVWVEGTTVGLL